MIRLIFILSTRDLNVGILRILPTKVPTLEPL